MVEMKNDYTEVQSPAHLLNAIKNLGNDVRNRNGYDDGRVKLSPQFEDEL